MIPDLRLVSQTKPRQNRPGNAVTTSGGAQGIVLNTVAQDGETHWMEGVMLLGVYVIIALAFYHLPDVAVMPDVAVR